MELFLSLFVPFCLWLYLFALGCTFLSLAVPFCLWLYLFTIGCTFLPLAVPFYLSKGTAKEKKVQPKTKRYSQRQKSTAKGKEKLWSTKHHTETS
jgi:ABC-type transport system involved in cytochrome bd biosynthesis fused ATPase/permease subunit